MMPGMFGANIAHGGATVAVAVKSKKPKMKQLAGSTAFTAVLGITEPALYGVTLKLKTPLLAAMIGGSIEALFCGLTQVKAYAMGSTGLASIAMFIVGGIAFQAQVFCHFPLTPSSLWQKLDFWQ